MDYFPVILPLLLVTLHGTAGTGGTELGLQARGGGEKPPPHAPGLLRRAKRCSCSSLMDKECVYFCHLDIIWVNTPEHVVPYGLGSPSRSKRALKELFPTKAAEYRSRCRCANQKDKKCWNFCQAEEELRSQDTMEKAGDNPKKGKDCSKLGKKCVHQQLVKGRKLRRLEAISNSIKPSSPVAKLKAILYRERKVGHNRTH